MIKASTLMRFAYHRAIYGAEYHVNEKNVNVETLSD